MRTVVRILGVAALLVGALWIGQGTGVIRWPASSFMVGSEPWALRGATMLLVGAVALWLAARMRR